MDVTSTQPPLDEIEEMQGEPVPIDQEEMESQRLEIDKEKHAKEHYRLAGRPALKTVLILSVGPILSQITAAIYGIVDTIYVSKAIGEKGMTAISTYTTFDTVARAFGYFVSVAGSFKISALFAKGESDEAGQCMCDLLRMCILFGILVPAVLCPTIQDAIRWFGASEEIVYLGWDYILPILICSVFTCIYIGVGGFLQGEGRSGLYGIVTIASSIANMCVLKPLLLFGIKMGIRGASIATCIAEGIPGLVMAGLFFAGKFAVKPKFRQLFRKFSKETMPSLKVGLSQLIANLSTAVPGLIMRKLIGASVTSEQEFNDSLAGFNLLFRWAQVTNSVVLAITMGYLPAASYAYQACNAKRWLLLSLHSGWICLAWSTLSCILTWAAPDQVAKMFSTQPGYLKWAGAMVQKGNALAFCIFSRFNIPTMLQSMQMGITSTLVSLFCQFVSILGFALLLYYTNKHDPVRLCWSYSMSYAFGLVLGGFVLIVPLKTMVKMLRDRKAIKPAKTMEASEDSSSSQKENLPMEEISDLENEVAENGNEPTSTSTSSNPEVHRENLSEL